MHGNHSELGAETTQHYICNDHVSLNETDSASLGGEVKEPQLQSTTASVDQEEKGDDTYPSPDPRHGLSNHDTSFSAEDKNTYPEGGFAAWRVVIGSWCGLMVGLGIANTIASFQAYILLNQLSGYDAGTVGWIFSVYAFIAFALGLVIGPVFDRYGPKWLVTAGGVCICLCLFLLGECTAYWHFMLVFGVVGGLGTSLLFCPCLAALGHWFKLRRGEATGIASTGGAFGGIWLPLTLESLIPKVGFTWSCRIIGFIFIILCLVASLLTRSRLPPEIGSSAKPSLRPLLQPIFAITVVGVFLIEWALFVPLTYISSYALHQGFSTSFSYYVLVILNAGSVFGRWLPGYFADRIGRFNASILALSLTIFAVFAIWLPFGHTRAGLVVFAFTFGLASGSNISLTPVAVGQLCPTQEYGRYYATCYTIVSVGCLTGIPIAGSILGKNGGEYWGLIVFVGGCYVGALLAFVVARCAKTGFRFRAVF